jgi:predicted GNAT family N-acyltransferase
VARHVGRFIAKASCFVEAEVTEYVSAHIVGVCVTPQFRGQAVAEALVNAVIWWAQEEACADRIRLFVMQTNDRAAAFYQRIGFVPTGATMAYPPNPTYTEHEMEHHGDHWPIRSCRCSGWSCPTRCTVMPLGERGPGRMRLFTDGSLRRG